MSKVAVMMSENQVKAKMSSHFGKAEWVMVVDTDCMLLTLLRSYP
jgi:predicted Fe-Mo cluster-binding NifX family protein